MVPKKKRPPPALEPIEVAVKKNKVEDEGQPSDQISVKNEPVYKELSDSDEGEDEEGEEEEEEEEDEDHQVDLPDEHEEDNPHQNHVDHGIADWPEADLMELMKRMETNIPQKDILRFDSRVEKLNWKDISFGEYTPEQCKETWKNIQKRIRRFRLLREVLEDAKTWVSKPWTNFYASHRQNRHPELPRRPLSTFMLYYLEKKDQVAKENPGMEMTGVSKLISEMYKNLSPQKKQKYVDMALTQRKEYEEKLEQFNREHPDYTQKEKASVKEQRPAPPGSVPQKPSPPFKLFYTDKLNRHKNDPDFDKNALHDKCKEQWKNMPDKKKIVWINWALEEEAKYQEDLKAYMTENPDFILPVSKPLLTKEEKLIKDRVAGKPEKPPNSAYSLFSRLMLVNEELKKHAPKDRMTEISKMWKLLPDSQKKKYQEHVADMLDQYKLEYATYLESLPEDKRQEELLKNTPKRKVVKPKVEPVQKPLPAAIPVPKPKPIKKAAKESAGKTLFKGEPEPPPVNAYELFLISFMKDVKHIDPIDYREKEAPRCWQMLPESEKGKYRRRLYEMKQKYIKEYGKFLQSLTPEELKEYSKLKGNLKKNEQESSEESDAEDNDSDNSRKSNNQQESGSEDDTSSDSDSDSSDSSDSDGDSKSSSSDSDSE